MAVAPGVGNVFYGNYFSKNAWILSNMGDAAQQGNGSVLYHNNFVDNYNYELAVSIDSAEKCSFDDGKEGNYWSAYQGIDSDGDGIGDTPYSLDSAHKDNYPLMAPYDLADVPELTFKWLKTSTLHLISPTEASYADEDVPLYFVTEGETQGYRYSLDGQDMTRIDGNTALPRLNEGQYNVTVFAVDDLGNSVASQTVTFTVMSPIQAGIDSFSPTFWAIVLGSIVAAFLVGALLYKRRKNKKEKRLTCLVLGGGKLCSQRTPQTCFQLGI